MHTAVQLKPENSKRKIIKASYQGCPAEVRTQFSHSSFVMPISVDHGYQAGEKLRATVTLVNRTFQRGFILLNDTLQRHTLKIESPDLDDATALAKSQQDGQAWLDVNQDTLNQFSIPIQVIRWEHWLSHPDFATRLAELEAAMASIPEFKQAIHANIEEYLARKVKQLSGLPCGYETAYKLCLTYLKEECACMKLWVQTGAEFEIYPNERNKAMTATYRYLIAPSFPNLLRFVGLRFKKS